MWLPSVDALIDRDALSDLTLDCPHLTVMNSWFFMQQDARPPSQSIDSVFHGFCGGRDELFNGAWLDYLRVNAPIGCRDTRTVERLHTLGVAAHFTGCITLSLGRSFVPIEREARKGIYIIDVHGDVERQRVPSALSERAARLSMHLDPLLINRTAHRFRAAFLLLRRLAQAELVITRRLHVALPCLAFGTPVIVLPDPMISDARLRLSGYETFLPIRWPEDERPWSVEELQELSVPNVIQEKWESIAARTGFTPPLRSWDEPQQQPLQADPIEPSPGTRLAHRLGVDEEPLLRDAAGRPMALPYPFPEKIAGEIVEVPAHPLDMTAALYDFTTRMGVEELGRGVGGAGDAAVLDPIVRKIAQDRLFDPVAQLWRSVLRQGRYLRLEAAWHEAGVAFGGDVYDVGRWVETLWRAGDFTGARRAIAESGPALNSAGFERHNNLFHREKNQQLLTNFAGLLDFEEGATDLSDPRFVDPHPFLAQALYEPIWDAFAALEPERAHRLVALYIQVCRKIGYGPADLLWPIEHFLVAQGRWTEARVALDSIDASAFDAINRAKLAGLEVDILRASGSTITETQPLVNTISVDWAVRDETLRRAVVRLAAGSSRARADVQAQLVKKRNVAAARGLSAELCLQDVAEALARSDVAVAHAAALQAAELGGAGLTETLLAAIDVLCAHGDRESAAALYRSGYQSYYLEQDRLFPTAAEARLAVLRGDPRDAWVLCGWGIGDDLLRLAIAARMFKHEIFYDLDSRLVGPASRGAAARFQFSSPPRLGGVDGVGREAFWRARQGVPRGLDATRFTSERVRFARLGGAVLHNEEMLPFFLEQSGWTGSTPILVASPQGRDRAAQHLAGLRQDQPLVGVAWRSGMTDGERGRYFYTVEVLAPLFACDAQFLILQHGLRPEEREFLAAFPNVTTLEGLDVANDFDALVALGQRLNLMIGPRLSTRDLMAAAGTPTLSIAKGYPLIEAWRIVAGLDTDLLFPNLRHPTHRTGADPIASALAAVQAL